MITNPNTRREERLPKEGETVFQAVNRVVAFWQENQRVGCFDEYPVELQEKYPEIFGQMDREAVGVVLSCLWLYLGGSKSPITKAKLYKWIDDELVVKKNS